MKPPLTIPPVEIEIDGTRLAQDVQSQLIEVRVQQKLSLPSVCELSFLDPQGVLGTRDLFAPGRRLRVRVERIGAPLFAGEITGVDYVYQSRGREVRVRGYDLLNRLARQQSVRAFVRAGFGDIAQDLAKDLGFTFEGEGSDPPWDRVIQHVQTDLQLLCELADRRGLCFFLADDTFKFGALDGWGAPVPLHLGEELVEATFARNDLHQCEAVSSAGWDTWRVEAHRGAADASDLDHGNLGGGSLSSYTSLLVNEPAREERDAQGYAQAELDYRTAQRLTLTGVAGGDPRLTPGTRVEVSGVASAVQGTYVLTAINHIISPSAGFVSEIRSAPARRPTRKQGLSLTLGVVARTDDPDRLGRIQITLPAFGDVATDWVQLVSPWAGAGKGFMAQPDVEDLVLFLFFEADITQGIVLGSAYGAHGPPTDWSKDTKGQAYTFVTPGGQKLVLNDTLSTARIQTAQGSFIELTPDQATLHATTPLRIEAPGKPVVIAGQTIDFQQS